MLLKTQNFYVCYRLSYSFFVSENSVVAIANEKQRIYGVQFHPEVDLTKNGKQIFKTFLYKIAGMLKKNDKNMIY